MTTETFFEQLDARIAAYDLLCHPFYKAWSAGELSRDELREYACDYYQHVEAFPTYLAEFAMRLEDSDLRAAVLANLCDEKGDDGVSSEPANRSHSELWLDFAEGMGASRKMYGHEPVPQIKALVSHFSRVAREGKPEEALATFYAYESQVPRVAGAKAKGLREMYSGDEKTTAYFTLHETADLYHSRVWRQQLQKLFEQNPAVADNALNAAEAAAKTLWAALDGIEARRTAKLAA